MPRTCDKKLDLVTQLLKDRCMKLCYLAIIATTALLCSCCVDHLVFSGNGNVNSGVIGASIDLKACSPVEKSVADQLQKASDWYRLEWENCARDAHPAGCRESAKQVGVQKDRKDRGQI